MDLLPKGVRKYWLTYHFDTTKGRIWGNTTINTKDGAGLTEDILRVAAKQIGERHDKLTLVDPALGLRRKGDPIMYPPIELDG